MTIRALVIDDDKEIIRTVGDILDSLGHRYDAAGDQESARKLLEPDKYAYVLLDLEIPVRPGRLCRIQNGKNLLAEIRQTSGMAHVPVIVMTGHGSDGPDLAVSVFKGGAVDYVQKPLDGGKLDTAIREALAKGGVQPTEKRSGCKVKPDALESFRAKQREMVIHEDNVTVCGVTVWQDSGQPDVRKVLLMLNNKENNKYVRMNGTRLGKSLKRNASNPISRPIKDFRNRATELLAEHCGLECGREDIIASGGGGYHFTEWMTVRVAGSQAHEPDEPRHEPVREPNEPANEPSEPTIEKGLNDRQHRILAEIDKGTQLRQKDVIAMFRRNFNPSTVKRDLKGLRDRGLIKTHSDGYFIRSSDTQATRKAAKSGLR